MIKLRATWKEVRMTKELILNRIYGIRVPNLYLCVIIGDRCDAFFREQLIDDSGGQEIKDEIARLERAREDGEL